MSGCRVLCLGAGDGWHFRQLRSAAAARNCELHFATYESLDAAVASPGRDLECEAGPLREFDAILTRTMPAGSLEQITFRLAMLHALDQQDVALVNPPRALEIAIDKFATLQHVQQLGYSVPATFVVQNRAAAMEAFDELGRDCVIKPLFGGEGRGVMRVRDRELAWTTFSTLEQLGAVLYVQKFVGGGGCDTRLLVIGETVIGVGRRNPEDFRANVAGGGTCHALEPSDDQITMARHICDSIGLRFGAVDLIETETGAKVIEVNAIPGWRGAQSVTSIDVSARIIQLLQDSVTVRTEASCG